MLYIFCGNDYTTIKERYNLLLSAQKLTAHTFDTVKDMCLSLYQTELINKDIAYCVKYDEDFMKATDAWENIKKASENKTVILFFTEINKQTKFYKFFEQNIMHFGVEEESPLWGFISSVCKRDLSSALIHSWQINATDAIYAFNTLYNKFRRILQIQTTPKGVKLEANTGLENKEYYKNKMFLDIYYDADIVYILQLIDYCVEQIKTGVLKQDIALEYFIIKIA